MPLPLTVLSSTPDSYNVEAARLEQRRISRMMPVPDVDEQPFLLLAVELSFDLDSHTPQMQPGTVATDDEVGQLRVSRPDWSLFLVHNSLLSGVSMYRDGERPTNVAAQGLHRRLCASVHRTGTAHAEPCGVWRLHEAAVRFAVE